MTSEYLTALVRVSLMQWLLITSGKLPSAGGFFSGSGGFSLLCRPLVQPGIFRNSVKSVLRRLQHDQPLSASWNTGTPGWCRQQPSIPTHRHMNNTTAQLTQKLREWVEYFNTKIFHVFHNHFYSVRQLSERVLLELCCIKCACAVRKWVGYNLYQCDYYIKALRYFQHCSVTFIIHNY